MENTHLVEIVGKPAEEHLVGRVRNDGGDDAGDVARLAHGRVLAVTRHGLVVVGATQLQRLALEVDAVKIHSLDRLSNTPNLESEKVRK